MSAIAVARVPAGPKQLHWLLWRNANKSFKKSFGKCGPGSGKHMKRNSSLAEGSMAWRAATKTWIRRPPEEWCSS